MNESCAVNEPYPTTETGERNPCWAALLYNDYAGGVGELGAITKYIYQALTVAGDNSELASDLRCIAMTEMRHLELVGELIVSLGGDPKYRTLERCAERWWSGGNLNYCRDIRYFLREDIKCEQKAIAGYRLRLCQIRNEAVQTLIERIIKDELRHIEIFESWLDRLERDGE